MAVAGSVEEVQTFLSLIAEERIQREFDGATRNEKALCILMYILFALCIFLEYVFCLYFYLCIASIK